MFQYWPVYPTVSIGLFTGVLINNQHGKDFSKNFISYLTPVVPAFGAGLETLVGERYKASLDFKVEKLFIYGFYFNIGYFL